MVARRLSGSPEAYDYLAESIKDWPAQPELARRIAAAGWSAVRWRNLSLGVVAMHLARRPAERGPARAHPAASGTGWSGGAPRALSRAGPGSPRARPAPRAGFAGAARQGLDSGKSTCEAVHKIVRTIFRDPRSPPQSPARAAAAARGSAPGDTPVAGPGAPSRPALTEDADVIVVGAGPAGSATAAYLARAGVDVLLLEKASFPREKVCGDGLTPRAVKALVGMGVPVDEQDGWVRNKGLRIIGGGVRLELPWPELSSYPGYGLVRTRLDFDEILARTAQKAGARLLEGVTVTGPVLDDDRADHRGHRPVHRRRRRAGTQLPRPGRRCGGWEFVPAVAGHGAEQA